MKLDILFTLLKTDTNFNNIWIFDGGRELFFTIAANLLGIVDTTIIIEEID